MNPTLRLLDFKVENRKNWKIKDGKDNSEFVIQMFGIDEKKVTHSVFVKGFEPFFYIKTNTKLTDKECTAFKNSILEKWKAAELKKKLKQRTIERDSWSNTEDDEGSYYENSITGFELTNSETLYGFDNHKEHQFIEVRFKNTTVFNKVKNLFFETEIDPTSIFGKKFILKPYYWRKHKFELYESKLPPLLRFFHIKNISPSGWIELPRNKLIKNKGKKRTFCHFEHTIEWDDVIPLPEKETAIPIKICSFDIEASSSHGDFPMPIKTYVKLSGEIVTYWNKNFKTIQKLTKKDKRGLLKQCILSSFGFKNMADINLVYPKKPVNEKPIRDRIHTLILTPIADIVNRKFIQYKSEGSSDDVEDEDGVNRMRLGHYIKKNKTIVDYLNDDKEDNSKKMEIIDQALTKILPPLEGDKVTFIGSTFMYFGECEPYLNHGICLGSCNDFDIENSKCEIICHENERDVLIEWKRMLQQHQPDIIIGYNIFGFDWKFLCDRAHELNCFAPKNYDNHGEWFCEISKNRNIKSKRIEKTIKIASGEHNLTFLGIDGVIQIDLYNHFRREVNLPSYKLQNVASHFIGDMIKKWEHCEKTKTTKLYSGNLTGLQRENFVCFEMIAHSSDKYDDGAKFRVIDLDESSGIFTIDGLIYPDEDKKLRWGLGKDDISVSDLFHAFSDEGTIQDRTKIARYCFQDCNLVHHLLRKNDIITGMSEIASICSVPIDFIVMRGQGIKLLSFIAKKCANKNTMMPVLQKAEGDGSYEGAICFPPKCGLYIDNPVAVVDYSSLYPSCMISENISHDSKVWTKEYNLEDMLIKETGVKNKEGEYIYDNLEEFKYVDVKYDTYQYIRPAPNKKEQKVKVGYKICRYVQFNKNKKAIMPSILTELLGARKATRAKIKYKTIIKNNGEEVIGIPSDKGDSYVMKQLYMEDGVLKNTVITVDKSDVDTMKDTYNSFMKNVFNQRQLGIKVTANSLYGQCGARTSAFYDKDIAASTTATGRKLLVYGKKVIEGVYGDAIVDTKFGKVKSKAEVVYGDSVTPDTPLLLRNKHTGFIEFKQIDDINHFEDWEPYDGFKAGESNRREKQQKCVNDYEIYTSDGWSNIRRVIRHKTNKKIYRINTHTGMVDVTEDHSLLDENLDKLKPDQAKIGMKLYHKYPEFKDSKLKLVDILQYIKNIASKSIEEKEAFIYGFFYGDGSCGSYNCPSGKKNSWTLNQKNMETTVILQSLCIEVFNEDFKILDTLKSSGVYKIVPACGNIKKYVNMFREVCYNKDKFKIIPSIYLNSDIKFRLAYFAGYYWADGAKCPNEKTKCIRMDNKGKIGSAMLYYLAKSLGFNVSLNTRKDKLNIIRLTATTGKQRKNPNIIKKIDYIGDSRDFVYDIETETGNFNTGFPLIVKNTDSAFVAFNLEDLSGEKIIGKKALEITIELAIEAGELSSEFLKAPHDLEYEKTFDPFLLLSKKRYVGMLYETDPNKCKRKSMGIVLKRRDNAPIVKDVYGGIIDILMNEQDVLKSIEFTKQCLQDIVEEKCSLDKLIISKSLRSFYKNPESIAHKVLADRIAERDPGNKPTSGARIPFVFIQTKKKEKLQGNRIETPEFIRENKLRPDYAHYITNQIMKPVQQVYALLLDQIPEFKSKLKALRRHERSIQRQYKDDNKKCREKINKIRNKEVKELIFSEALRDAVNLKNNQKSIKKFFN
jgi:DNA polymerase elongation subunit (family B)|uniref:DNA polymerase n=1 Tax=viral metagenome TaxID=1070528 RepID=A0A6C0C197_9ZZZZ